MTDTAIPAAETKAVEAESKPVGKAGTVSAHVGGHRKDIEGMRALSILMIMVWHAGFNILPGGFVSLDVFFVISGFLITQLLVEELRTTGRLRLRRFYGRRAKRLLPAPTVVIIVTAFIALFVLPRSEWMSTAFDIIFTALYSMNWWLAAQSTDYFNQSTTQSIYEHFWSLSLEEQFYLVWPCLLAYVAMRSFQQGRRSLGPPLLIAFALIGIPSFAWSVYYSAVQPGPAYFVTTTRAWEFALGGALAMLTFTDRKLPRWLAIVTGWAGLIAIFVAARVLTPSDAYPSYLALIPCLATCAMITAGFTAGRAGPVALLGTAPMQVIGRMSYSLYLCHWPVLTLTAVALGHELSPVEGLVVVTLSAIPAYLLHRYIENPIRYSRTMFRDSAHMLKAAAVATCVSLLSGMTLYMANWPPPPPFVAPTIATLAIDDGTADGGSSGGVAKPDPRSNPNSILGAGILGDPPLGDPNGAPKDTSNQIVPDPTVAGEDYIQCTQVIESSEVRTCAYGKQDSDTVVAVVGDSHANQWIPGLSKVAEANGWALVEYTKAACSFSDVLVATKDQKAYPSCNEWSAAVLDRLMTTERPTMVITTQLSKGVFVNGQLRYDPVGKDVLSDGLRRYYQALADAGIPVLVIQDSPEPQEDIADCVEQHPTKLTECSADRAAMLPADHNAEQTRAANGLPNVRLVDFNDAICPTERCAPVIGNVLIYRDNSHLTGTYVRTLVPVMQKRITLP